jgi:hypothetical protein
LNLLALEDVAQARRISPVDNHQQWEHWLGNVFFDDFGSTGPRMNGTISESTRDFVRAVEIAQNCHNIDLECFADFLSCSTFRTYFIETRCPAKPDFPRVCETEILFGSTGFTLRF